MKKNNDKVRAHIKLTCHWKWQLYISLLFLWYLTSTLDWNRVIYCNNKPTRRQYGETDSNRKWYKESSLEFHSKIFKSKSKDRDSNFLLKVFIQLKSYWDGRDDPLMLVAIGDDTWNVFNMQHITPNSKRWDHSDIPVMAIKKNEMTCPHGGRWPPP